MDRHVVISWLDTNGQYREEMISLDHAPKVLQDLVKEMEGMKED